MQLLHCKTCLMVKPESDFYASNHTKCKECVKTAVCENRSKNAEYYKEFDRKRANLPHRVEARRQYRETEAYAEAHAKANLKYLRDNPMKLRARNAVNKAIIRGKMKPWPICAIPECDCKPEAHHPDYSRPLDVVWLCDFHHKQAHALVKKIDREAA